MGIHDDTARAIYLKGGTRKQVMRDCCINTNQVASLSNRLGFHWSWPLENRKSGIPPVNTEPTPTPKARAKRTAPFIKPSRPHTPTLAAVVPPQTPPEQELVPVAAPADDSSESSHLTTAPSERPAEPAIKKNSPETFTPKRPPLEPSPGFVPERVRRLKGLGRGASASDAFPSDENEFEKLIRTRLY